MRLPDQASPFPWQVRLLKRFLQGDLPRTLDLPTGLGKTKVMAIWLVARALGAPLPRRLIYVVDRRAVVDQSTAEAEKLRVWLDDRPDLRRDLGLADRPLPISTLRGQFADNREWLEDPSATGIVVGTVDMTGSRLLFSGYAVSRKMRPMHAGLMGSDTLFVLDESHLVPPFERLIASIADDADQVFGPADGVELPVPRLKLLSLSATSRDASASPFRLKQDDHDHPIVQQRMSAPKRVTVASVNDAKALPDALALHAWSVVDDGQRPRRVIVFSRSRDVAGKAKAAFDALAKKAKVDVETDLFVGARRVRERQAASERLQAMGFLAGHEGTDPTTPSVLFATSAAEVGVDLDADDMVADLSTWDSMVQRLGRVNRRGARTGEAASSIVVLKVDDDEATPARWAPFKLLPTDAEGRQQVHPAALADLARDAEADPDVAQILADATSDVPYRPALDRPTLDAWAMTSLREHPGRPDVAPWLRGWIEDKPQTALIWRAHLPVRADGTTHAPDVEAYFDAAPRHRSEELETTTDAVFGWLDKRRKSIEKVCAKAEASGEPPPIAKAQTVLFLASSSDDAPANYTLGDLLDIFNDDRRKKGFRRDLAGATVFVHAEVAGLSPDGLLDPAAKSAPVTADDPEAWAIQPDADPIVPTRIRRTTAPPADRRSKDDPWQEVVRLPYRTTPDGEPIEWTTIDAWRHLGSSEDGRSITMRPQRLEEHGTWAATCAERIGRGVGLSGQALHALTIAARLHDEGKQAARWQNAFRAPADGPWAKTRGPVNPHLLQGYRHEFGSLPYAEADAAFQGLPADLQDLVLHLIAAHHGYARPVIRAVGDDGAPPSALEARASQVAHRFLKLQDRWGPWGLAWWEALLRAADAQASRLNDLGTPPPNLEVR